MEEGSLLPVSYNGKNLFFPVKLTQFGYVYKVEVDVNGLFICFERDEEQNWRVIVDQEIKQYTKGLDTGLLSAIADSLDKLENY
jgi:hypothetical protein